MSNIAVLYRVELCIINLIFQLIQNFYQADRYRNYQSYNVILYTLQPIQKLSGTDYLYMIKDVKRQTTVN